MQPSHRWQFSANDFNAFIQNALWFTAPVILIYLVSVLTLITEPSHTMSFADFVPNEATKTAVVVWVLNRAVDFFRRYQSGK
jgi:hypothetical protein